MTLREQIMRDEGSVKEHGLHVCYKDSLGYWTIGYGHLCATKREPITEEEAQKLLDADIEVAKSEALRRWPWIASLDEVHQNVMYNMAFNLGCRKLSGFMNFLKHMEHKEFKEARAAMLDSLWARQVKGRATRLADLVYLEGKCE